MTAAARDALGRFAVTQHNLDRKHRRLFIIEKKEIPAVREEIASSLASLGYSQRDVFAVRLATEEVLLNAIEHGNRCDKTKKVTVTYVIDERKTEITVTDEGHGFDLDSVPDCTAADNLCKTRGRGIALMRGFMDDVEFSGNGNTVRLVKLNSSAGAAPPDQSQEPLG